MTPSVTIDGRPVEVKVLSPEQGREATVQLAIEAAAVWWKGLTPLQQLGAVVAGVVVAQGAVALLAPPRDRRGA